VQLYCFYNGFKACLPKTTETCKLYGETALYDDFIYSECVEASAIVTGPNDPQLDLFCANANAIACYRIKTPPTGTETAGAVCTTASGGYGEIRTRAWCQKASVYVCSHVDCPGNIPYNIYE